MNDLKSFKELLLRKTDDESLRTLIKMAADEVLADQLLESLQKMATNRSAGSHANLAIRDFGTEMDPELEPSMIREALGHHASRYKAALGSGDSKTANDHASQFFKILDMIHKVQPHSHGKLQAETVDVKPWERTHGSRSETFAQRMARDPEYAKDNPVTRGKKLPHQFVNDTVGFSFQPKGNDWSFLQNDPHAAYSAETTKHGHVGPYPMEHTKINGKFIPIEDIENVHDGKKNHPFDQHPILQHYSESVKSRTPERENQYLNERDAYMSSPHIGHHLEHQQDLISSGQRESRGLQPGPAVHAGSKRAEIPQSTSKGSPLPEHLGQFAKPAAENPVVVRRPKTEPASAAVEDAKSKLPSHLHDLLDSLK
jgi:hypothetical protein